MTVLPQPHACVVRGCGCIVWVHHHRLYDKLCARGTLCRGRQKTQAHGRAPFAYALQNICIPNSGENLNAGLKTPPYQDVNSVTQKTRDARGLRGLALRQHKPGVDQRCRHLCEQRGTTLMVM